MTTQDYKRKSPLSIFLHYFGNHKGLFAIDLGCAVGIAAIDLAFPLITRKALYDLLPNQLYRTFFFIMLAVALSYVLRTFLNYIVAFRPYHLSVISILLSSPLLLVSYPF